MTIILFLGAFNRMEGSWLAHPSPERAPEFHNPLQLSSAFPILGCSLHDSTALDLAIAPAP